MDIVKNQLGRIQQQLSGLTASQKMLTGALVAIMVMTLLYWGRQAGTAEMEAVLDQDLSTTDLGQIQGRLAVKGIKYVNSGSRILVPADRKMEILADLAYARALPQNTESGFERMAAKLTAFSSGKERDAMQNSVRETTCSQVIALFPDVASAQVVIDATRERHIGGNIEPSAMINVTTRGGANLKQIADSAAAVVAGAKSGLPLGNISVIIDGQKQRLRAANGGAVDLAGADDLFESMTRLEQYHEEKIRKRFQNVTGLLVSVSVKLNTDRVRKHQQKYDPKGTFTKELKTRTSESETTSESPPDDEAGAGPNVTSNRGLSVARGGEGSSTRTEETETESKVLEDKTTTYTETEPGAPTVVSASVGVPRSYFVNWLRVEQPTVTSPDEATIQNLAKVQLKRIEEGVRASVGADPETLIAVSDFADAIPSLNAAVPQTATMSVPLMLGNHSKEIALGGLALVSLFMVSMMVKKSAPAPALIAAGAAAVFGGSTPQLASGEAVAGEAGSGNSMLDGMELDEEAVRTQQMLDQVSTLVTDNPDAAASLVKRWLNRD